MDALDRRSSGAGSYRPERGSVRSVGSAGRLAQRELGVDARAGARPRRPRAAARRPAARPRRRVARVARRSARSAGCSRRRLERRRVDAAQHLARVEQRRAGSRAARRTARPPRPSTSRLISSQLAQDLAARVSAARRVSPKTCGWRRISFSAQRLGDGRQVALRRAPRAAARGRGPGRGRRRARRRMLRVVAAVRGVGELVGLLDRVRDDRALVLLAVPGALPAQPAGDLVEALERVEVGRLRHRRVALPRSRSRRRQAREPDGAGAAARARAGGCGPCGAAPVTGTNGLNDPGAPGVGPLPVHCSWPAWPRRGRRALLAGGEDRRRAARCRRRRLLGRASLGSQVGPPPLKLSQPWTT